MTKFLWAILCLLATTITWSQQDRQFTHYMFDHMSYNPAATGFKGFCGTIIYRNQWDFVQDAPNTTVFNAQGNLQNLRLGPGRLGVGLSFSNDVIGFQRNNNFLGNVAYHLPVTSGTISAGLGLGIINVGFDPDWIPPSGTAASDPVIAPINQKISASGFDSNFGLYWRGKRGYYVGVSTTHLVPKELTKVNFSLARHYYFSGGSKHQLRNNPLRNGSPLFLRPSFLIKADGATMVFDINLTADIWMDTDSYFWTGATYRYSDGVGLMVGYGRNNLKVGYSFDIMTNPLSEHGKGSHELMVSYCIFPPPCPISSGGHTFILE